MAANINGKDRKERHFATKAPYSLSPLLVPNENSFGMDFAGKDGRLLLEGCPLRLWMAPVHQNPLDHGVAKNPA